MHPMCQATTFLREMDIYDGAKFMILPLIVFTDFISLLLTAVSSFKGSTVRDSISEYCMNPVAPKLQNHC